MPAQRVFLILKSAKKTPECLTVLLSMQTFSISLWHHAKCRVFADKSASFMQTTGNSRNLLANLKEGLGAAPSLRSFHSVTANNMQQPPVGGIMRIFPLVISCARGLPPGL